MILATTLLEGSYGVLFKAGAVVFALVLLITFGVMWKSARRDRKRRQ